ncbi:hypothetical protein SVAN01_05452 [Stagonosporopsis vannaccii]|nr:hypothetical protein SVAN01_05452 [Stagonosporopsis vannaccii]
MKEWPMSGGQAWEGQRAMCGACANAVCLGALGVFGRGRRRRPEGLLACVAGEGLACVEVAGWVCAGGGVQGGRGACEVGVSAGTAPKSSSADGYLALPGRVTAVGRGVAQALWRRRRRAARKRPGYAEPTTPRAWPTAVPFAPLHPDALHAMPAPPLRPACV